MLGLLLQPCFEDRNIYLQQQQNGVSVRRRKNTIWQELIEG